MVLVDTSVWVCFLANKAPYAAGLDGLLAQGEVVAHAFVYGELLVGDAGVVIVCTTAPALTPHSGSP
jgi:hypothetical protein